MHEAAPAEDAAVEKALPEGMSATAERWTVEYVNNASQGLLQAGLENQLEGRPFDTKVIFAQALASTVEQEIERKFFTKPQASSTQQQYQQAQAGSVNNSGSTAGTSPARNRNSFFNSGSTSTTSTTTSDSASQNATSYYGSGNAQDTSVVANTRASSSTPAPSVSSRVLQDVEKAIDTLAGMDPATQAGITDAIGVTHIGTSHMNLAQKIAYGLGYAGTFFTGAGEEVAVVRGLEELQQIRSVTEDVRVIAASNIREARNILRDAGLDPSERNQIIKSFDLETFRVEKVMNARQEYRLFDDSAAKLQGRYTSPNFLENQAERITKFALPNNAATRLGIVEIPEGATVFTGRVAQQFELSPGLIGGEQQTFLLGSLNNYTFEEVLMPRNTMYFNGGY